MTSWAGQRYGRRSETQAQANSAVSSHAELADGETDGHPFPTGIDYALNSGTQVVWQVGEGDLSHGVVTLLADGAGSNYGGHVYFHLGADHDTSFSGFLLGAWFDDLIIYRSNPTNILFKVAGDTGRLSGDGIVPTGVICMWHGTLANIPTGWVLCDGTNGTPDLRDKFVVGAAAAANPGSTGGATTHTHGTAGAHTHDAHSSSAVGDVQATQPTTALVGPSTHSSSGGHTHDAQSNLPPYYTVAYIMKT